jgi:hypothetical protein
MECLNGASVAIRRADPPVVRTHRWGHRAAEPPRSDRRIGAASFRQLSLDGSDAFLGTAGVSETAEVEYWRRRAACSHDVLVDRHPWALPTTRPISGSAQATIPRPAMNLATPASRAPAPRARDPNQQQGQAGPFPCVLGEGGA